MKRHFVLFCFVLFVCNKQKAQNLVPNWSFELQNDCNNSLLSDAMPWNTICGGGGTNACLNPCKTYSYTSVPFQYYDNCLQSYQIPRSGIAYAEFGTYTQSSTQESAIPFVKLLDTLKAGKTYCVTYYVSMWNNARYSIDKLGALLTPTAFTAGLPVICTSSNTVAIAGLYTPQVVTTPGVPFEDTLNWMEVSGSFIAFGNEAYLAIGDFFTHAQHYIKDSYPSNCNGLAEYYVDDVSVEEVQIANARNDTSIVFGDSTIIGNNASEAALFGWQPSAGLSCTTCPNPKASPSVTTTYTVTKTQCKVITTDIITVSVSPTSILENETHDNSLIVMPNPTNGYVNITSRFDFNKVEVIAITGQILLDETTIEKTCQLNLQNFVEGIYFIKVRYANGISLTKKLVFNR